MRENIRIGIASQVPELSRGFDTFLIGDALGVFFDKICSRINLEDLGGWKLRIHVVLRSTDGIGVFKKTRRYPSDKEFELSISIAIPASSQAAYGLGEAKKPPFFLPLDPKNFHVENPEFERFSSMHDYVLDAGLRAIDMAFTKGFVCGGKKIKFQES